MVQQMDEKPEPGVATVTLASWPCSNRHAPWNTKERNVRSKIRRIIHFIPLIAFRCVLHRRRKVQPFRQVPARCQGRCLLRRNTHGILDDGKNMPYPTSSFFASLHIPLLFFDYSCKSTVLQSCKLQSVHSTARQSLTRLPRPSGQGEKLVGSVGVARMRPRSSKGITDLLLSQTSIGLSR